MHRRVRTSDGVAWTVSIRRPVLRGDGGDLVVGRRTQQQQESHDFRPLLVVAGLLLLALLAPALVKSDRWWALVLLPVLAGVGWAMLARYPVELRREGSDEAAYRTLVAGRAQARRVADELAAEVERTPDEKLGG